MVDEFTAICRRFGQMAARGVCRSLKLWQQDFTPEQSSDLTMLRNNIACVHATA